MWKWIMYVTGSASVVVGYLVLGATMGGGAILIAGGTTLVNQALAMP